MEIGGGFGGKGQGGCYLEPVVGALARQDRPSGQDRHDPHRGLHQHRPDFQFSHIKVKVGGTRDGRFTAAQATLVYEAGAFPGSPVPSGCRTMFAPYEIRQRVSWKATTW